MTHIDAQQMLAGWSCKRPVADGYRVEQLRVWDHPKHGRFAAGLFDMYQTHGFPLCMSMEFLAQHGIRPCPAQERASALAAGWTSERFEAWWREGEQDMIGKKP